MKKTSLLVLASLLLSTAQATSTKCYKRVYGDGHFMTKLGQPKNLDQAFDEVYLRVSSSVDRNTKDKNYYEENGPNNWVSHQVEMAVSANTRKSNIDDSNFYQFSATTDTEDDFSQDQTYCVLNEQDITEDDSARIYGCLKLHPRSLAKGSLWANSKDNRFMSVVSNKNYYVETSGSGEVVEINLFQAVASDLNSSLKAQVSDVNKDYGLNEVKYSEVENKRNGYDYLSELSNLNELTLIVSSLLTMPA